MGVAVSNATDVAKGAASVVLTQDGLSGIIRLIEVGRQIHERITTWVINKTCRTLQTTGFVVISFLIRGVFIVDDFDMVWRFLLCWCWH